jgi:hypothetical protein
MSDEPVKTFEDAMRDHLVLNRQQLVKDAMDSAMGKLAESMKWSALEHANKQLNEFFATEVSGEIKRFLAENRETLIAQVIATMKTVVDAGLKKQAEEWIKEMDNSYSRGKTIAKMFGADR